MALTQTASIARPYRLFATCAAAAIATVTVHMPLRAQTLPPLAPMEGGFQGTFMPNGATVVQNGNNTTVTINAPRAIINWTPHDSRTGEGAIDFLPSDRTANFVNSGERFGSDYIVLNRIGAVDQSRAIALNGTVRSTLSSIASGAQGGQIWFYAPSGILVGANATFNVGSLLLSTNNVTDADFLDGDSQFSFGRDNSNASIQIANGAQISAISRDSYVAIIAPRIVQAGSVTVNGSAAYVAAEQVDMTISGSLFNIAVAVGSDAASAGGNTIEHSGQTTLTNNIPENGYGSGAQGPRQAIMVAVPKNDAVTMLVSGGIAYQQATGANVVDGKIILSGGYNVAEGAIGNAAPAGEPARAANIVMGSLTAGTVDAVSNGRVMDVEASATGTTSIGTPASSSFGGDVALRGAGGVSVTATGTGQTIRVAGDLLVDASGTENGGNQLASVKAVNRGTVQVGGTLTVSADVTGEGDVISSRFAEIVADGGTVTVGGTASVSADAGGSLRLGTAPINATAGTARILTNDADISRIDIAGSLSVSADGTGARGGSGTGGLVTVAPTEFGDGSFGLSFNGLSLTARGTGARGADSAALETGGFADAQAGGTGTGGRIDAVLIPRGNTTLDASASGGAGGQGVVGEIGYGSAGGSRRRCPGRHDPAHHCRFRRGRKHRHARRCARRRRRGCRGRSRRLAHAQRCWKPGR
jgi:filamentous hemagglutinin family protein